MRKKFVFKFPSVFIKKPQKLVMFTFPAFFNNLPIQNPQTPQQFPHHIPLDCFNFSSSHRSFNELLFPMLKNSINLHT